MKITKYLSLIFFLILFLTIDIFSQQPTRREIAAYVKKIDRQTNKNELTKIFYPDKTCGGGLEGYFSADKLVFMSAIDGGDQLEFRMFYYLKDGLIYRQVDKNYVYDRSGSNIDEKPTRTGKTRVFYPVKPDKCEQEMIDGLLMEKNRK